MKMKRCVVVPGILLMLSLEAALLVAAGRTSVDDDVGAILLPSEAKVADQEAAMAGKKRPWKCCDKAFCTKSFPPICRCMDEFFECPSTCKTCGPSMDDPSSGRQVCQDLYVGDPGPICRPWECCDTPSCTKSFPPICRCMDEVDKCAPTCKTCGPSMDDPSSGRQVCQDQYVGDPGPICGN